MEWREGIKENLSRKNVGLDLRKSLAWDTAFFREEGVLNENELSRLTTQSRSESLVGGCNDDENARQRQRQRQSRPSGLRMPSPSLKYFAAQGGSKSGVPSSHASSARMQPPKGKGKVVKCPIPSSHPKFKANLGGPAPPQNKSQLPPQHNLIHKSLGSSTQHTLLSNHKLNPPPFSDEWLQALEEVGEEILTKKTGAVQNSPPDKPLPEPGPWSPVKRKNVAEIGPFDCTKFSNQPGQNLNS